MKSQTGKITAEIGRDAKKRLAEMQTELRFLGASDRETSPGKLLARLILAEKALDYLKKEYHLR